MGIYQKNCHLSGLASAIGLTISFLSVQAIAQPNDSINDLTQCLNIENIEERVNCYDAAVGRDAVPVVQSSNSSESIVSELPVVNAQTNEGEIAQFGLDQSAIIEDDDGQQTLFDTIVEVKETQPRKWLITLGSGQVWKQTVAKRFQLREGSEVRIYKTSWGSDYRLGVVDRSGYIQVKRLR